MHIIKHIILAIHVVQINNTGTKITKHMTDVLQKWILLKQLPKNKTKLRNNS